ncbi:MAG TPA: magnesium and cobalt transport protein CorA [Micromonosporaceae bacterium]|nr:magnesium and cobalt transport protein CorA [Micromonosporaceae bacterium]
MRGSIVDRAERTPSRTWASPVRAVSRMWASAAPTPAGKAAAATSGRSAVVDYGVYVNGARLPDAPPYTQALELARASGQGFVWLGLHEPDEAEMTGIAHAFGLHELAAEDAVHAGQRPKLEQFGTEVTFLAMRTARYVEHAELTETSEVVETGHLMLFIGDHFVITVRHGGACRLAPVRAGLEGKAELLRQGPWAVAYAVTDHVVDLYLDVADRIEEDLDELEEEVFSRTAGGRVQQIYQLKRELVEFRRTVVPLQRPFATLVAEDSGVPPRLRRYFHDVLDHLTRTAEQVQAADDLLHSILAARLAQVTVDQNNDMRKIAAWAAIAAVQTAIAGVYGMNFEYMPELKMRYGYPVILGIMVVSALALYRLFRRSGWL